mgnify:CR=1 FL=1
MIERQIHLSSGGGAALQGYDGLLRFGYTKNRGIYALRVEADGEWQGMTLRAFWHLPGGNPAPSTLVTDGLVEVPALITAVPGEGRITFEGTDGTRTLTSADVGYCRKFRHGGQLPAPARHARLAGPARPAESSCGKRCIPGRKG